jgi:flagellar hook protein FlgE
MSFNVSNNINSAIMSGYSGLSRASDNITQHSANIANLSAAAKPKQDPQDFLTNAVGTQLNAIKQSLPTAATGSITTELVGLSVNSINAQASAKVIGTANDTIGTILDILA